MKRTRRLLAALAFASCIAGCGGGISVSGVLLKDGVKYSPPQGHKLAIYLYPADAAADQASNVEMALFDDRDGSFTVPGREGTGIAPGKYRIVLVETLRREAYDEQAKNSSKKPGRAKFDRDRNFLEAGFGEKSSPFVRELTSSTRLTLDMAKPTEGEALAANPTGK